MSDEVTLSIEGLSDLYKDLNALANSLPAEVVEDALLVGAMTIQQAVKQAAPVVTGNLQKHIQVKQLPKIGDSPKSAIVKSTAKHDHLIEFGTKPRRQKNGRFTGSMPADPFFRPAVDQNKEPVLRQVVEDLKAELDKAVG